MSAVLHSFKFKKGGRIATISFTLNKFMGDCGSHQLSGIGLEGTRGVKLEGKLLYKLFSYALKRATSPANSPHEVRKFIISHGNQIWSNTPFVAKTLRFKHVLSKSAHGGHKFWYGVKALNLVGIENPDLDGWLVEEYTRRQLTEACRTINTITYIKQGKVV